MKKELFHTYENVDMIINCYYLSDEATDQNHEVVCEYKNGHDPSTLTTNCREACIALCVQIEDNYQSTTQS